MTPAEREEGGFNGRTAGMLGRATTARACGGDWRFLAPTEWGRATVLEVKRFAMVFGLG